MLQLTMLDNEKVWILSFESLLTVYVERYLFICLGSIIPIFVKNSIWKTASLPIFNCLPMPHVDHASKCLHKSVICFQQMNMHCFIEIFLYVLVYYTWLNVQHYLYTCEYIYTLLYKIVFKWASYCNSGFDTECGKRMLVSYSVTRIIFIQLHKCTGID